MAAPSPPPELDGAARTEEGADGHGAPPEVTRVDPDNRTYERMSVRTPAIIVLGIAVFIVVAGVVTSAFTSTGSSKPATDSVTIPDGTVVRLTPATVALKSMVSEGQPPSDILGPLAVPAGSRAVGTVDTDQNANQFDRTVNFTTGLTSDQVVSVFHTLLPRLGWDVTFVGPARQALGTEVLAKKGSSDSFYWEVGVVVSPTTSAGTTPFSVEVFEQPEDN
jgi:hypothetical protein